MEQLTALLSAIAWPAIAVYVLIAYRGPIRKILEQLPSKLYSASKFEMGSLKIELESRLEGSGDANLVSAMQNLSREAYQKIIELRDPSHGFHPISEFWKGPDAKEPYYCTPGHRDLEVLQELERLRLIVATEPINDLIELVRSHPEVRRGDAREGGWSIPAEALSEETRERLKAFVYSLTNEGRRLYEAMTDVIIKQLSNESNRTSRRS